jgi:hypothetical protein
MSFIVLLRALFMKVRRQAKRFSSHMVRKKADFSGAIGRPSRQRGRYLPKRRSGTQEKDDRTA